ncbi:MAG TPA: hypothetical protein QGF95_20915 [Candidatus Latescibacteria bacterium]|nr:hypothetical protein [Candidatus Latescibacterota bacterium]HJP33017.1 hypothetical protein [Candidatus Latescibacterota bacterium]
MTTARTLRIGVVGTGNVARQNYIPCLAAEQEVELGLYSRTRARAETVAADLGGQVFESSEQLMAWDPETGTARMTARNGAL